MRRQQGTIVRLMALACVLPPLVFALRDATAGHSEGTTHAARVVRIEAAMQDVVVDSLQPEVHPGDRLRYRVVIKNTGDAVAQDVRFEAELDEFVVLSGPIATTPIARNDTLPAAADETWTVPAPGVLANDNDPDLRVADPFVVAWDEMSRASSTPNVSGSPSGAFQYVPPPGFLGIDTFGYRIQDQDGNRASAEVVMHVANRPRVAFFDVTPETNDPRVIPCASVEPCTIPTFTNFRVRFTATTDGQITGFTWQIDPRRWEPFGAPSDTVFLRLADVQGDTLALDMQGRPAWALSEAHDSVSVYVYSGRDEPLLLSGNGFSGEFLMRARARNEVPLESITRENGERQITVNYDPDTRLFTVPECDCPNAPPGCDVQKRVHVGWVTGIGDVDSLGTMDDWILFCEGDTIPNASIVRFYATGWDDARDLPIDLGAGLPETRYRFRFEARAESFSYANMPFSFPALHPSDLRLPSGVGGGTFRGASSGWQVCPFDYRFFASAVDEHDRVDGTPASVAFFAGGSPVIDSLHVPRVVVLVPTCPSTRLQFCPDYPNVTFGPDTLAVFGASEPDDFDPRFWQTPYGLGWNRFELHFKVFGHDHPRDRNPIGGPAYYSEYDEGHIRSWRFSYDCTEPGCQDFVFAGEDVWLENRIPTGQGPVDVFDRVLTIARVPLDTLCVLDEGGGCSVSSSRATLSFARLGEYVFEIQGRDTEFIGQTCDQPSDLGENAAFLRLPISEHGRKTALVVRPTALRMLADVRPKPSQADRFGLQQRPRAGTLRR